MAIVAMVGKNVTTYENSSSQNDDLACPLPEDSSAEEIYQVNTFFLSTVLETEYLVQESRLEHRYALHHSREIT